MMKVSPSGRVAKAQDFGDSPSVGAPFVAKSNGDVGWQSTLDDAVRAAWFVNESTGDDTAVGDSLHPIRTVAELNRRIGADNVIARNLTVTIVGASVGGFLSLNVARGYKVRIVGVPTKVSESQVATWTPISNSTNRFNLLTLSALADLSQLRFSRAVVTSGVGTGEAIWFGQANLYSLGVGTVECSSPCYRPDLNPHGVGTIADIDALDSSSYLEVQTLNRVAELSVTLSGFDTSEATIGSDQATTGSLTIESLDVGALSIRSPRVQPHSVVVWGCTLENLSVASSHRDGVEFWACQLRSKQSTLPSARYVACHFTSAGTFVTLELKESYLDNVLADGVGLVLSGGYNALGYCGVFRCVSAQADGIRVLNNAFVAFTNVVGQGNATTGVIVDRNAVCRSTNWASTTITGASGDWRTLATPTVYQTWANVRAFGGGGGTGTLTNGDLVVSIPGLPSDAAVNVSYLVPKVGAGILGVSNKNTSGFTVHSLDGTDSTSTVYWTWRAPSGISGGFFKG